MVVRLILSIVFVLAPVSAHRLQGTGLVLNEFLPNPQSGPEWVEIYNGGTEPVDLSGWHIDDEIIGGTRTTLPANTVIVSGSYLIVTLSGSVFNNSGYDMARLVNSQDQTVDSHGYTGTVAGQSYARSVDGGPDWVLGTPTPGGSNGQANPTEKPTETPTETPTNPPSETPIEPSTAEPTEVMETPEEPTETPTFQLEETDTAEGTPGSPTATATTLLPTASLTSTAIATPTNSPTSVGTPSKTPTVTKTSTATKTPTATREPTETKTPTATKTSTETKTPTATREPTATKTPKSDDEDTPPKPTRTPTLTKVPTPTKTPTLTKTPTETKTPTLTKTPTPTRTPRETEAPESPTSEETMTPSSAPGTGPAEMLLPSVTPRATHHLPGSGGAPRPLAYQYAKPTATPSPVARPTDALPGIRQSQPASSARVNTRPNLVGLLVGFLLLCLAGALLALKHLTQKKEGEHLPPGLEGIEKHDT
jgi:hypothetical protein